jgi:putative flippase GtrA
MISNVIKYKIFIKYTISAGISFILDIFLFTIFVNVLTNYFNDYAIIISTIMARICSSLVNYLLNRNHVFNHSNKNIYDPNTLFKYYLLVITQMGVSALSVFLIHKIIDVAPTYIKIPVDILIFIVNYFIQKHYIFRGSGNTHEK